MDPQGRTRSKARNPFSGRSALFRSTWTNLTSAWKLPFFRFRVSIRMSLVSGHVLVFSWTGACRERRSGRNHRRIGEAPRTGLHRRRSVPRCFLLAICLRAISVPTRAGCTANPSTDVIRTVMSSLPSFPRLRSEVSIVPFFSSAKEETYLVLLPDGRSLQTTRRLYELITHLDGSRSVEEIARILSGMWNRSIRPTDVRDWIDRYIVPHDLLVPVPDLPPPGPSPPAKSPSTKGIMLIPGRLALPLTRRLRLLFHPLCSLPLLWASALCHGLIYLDLLSGTRTGLFSSIPPSVYLIGYLVTFLSVLFHEFGHLSACQYFDCPHGEIRLGLYLLFPVFYANVSPAWRLERKARVVVDLAGMYFQLLVTIPVSLLFHLTREPVWLLLFLELDAMILFSLNPFLRFDGYWLCSDLLGVPNLRSRSQLLMKTLWSRLLSRTLLTAYSAPGDKPRRSPRAGPVRYRKLSLRRSGPRLLLSGPARPRSDIAVLKSRSS